MDSSYLWITEVCLSLVPVTRSVFCMRTLCRCLSEMHVVNKLRRKWVFCDSCFCDFKMSCFSPNFVKVSFIIEFFKGILEKWDFVIVLFRENWSNVIKFHRNEMNTKYYYWLCHKNIMTNAINHVLHESGNDDGNDDAYLIISNSKFSVFCLCFFKISRITVEISSFNPLMHNAPKWSDML